MQRKSSFVNVNAYNRFYIDFDQNCASGNYELCWPTTSQSPPLSSSSLGNAYCVLHGENSLETLCSCSLPFTFSVSTLDKFENFFDALQMASNASSNSCTTPLTALEQCMAAAATAAGAATNVYAIQLRLVVVPQHIVYDNSVSCSGIRVYVLGFWILHSVLCAYWCVWVSKWVHVPSACTERYENKIECMKIHNAC